MSYAQKYFVIPRSASRVIARSSVRPIVFTQTLRTPLYGATYESLFASGDMPGIVFVGLPKRTPVGMSFGSFFAQENAMKAMATHAARLPMRIIPMEFLKTVLLAPQGCAPRAMKAF